LATLFISQALGFQLSLAEQMKIIAVAMLTSKGAIGVTGAGFITLASTLAAINPELVPGMSIILGIDKFMSECRALTNLVGNSVAAVVVSRTEGELNLEMMKHALHGDGVANKLEDGKGDDVITEVSTEVSNNASEVFSSQGEDQV